MQKLTNFTILLILSLIVFSSCTKKDEPIITKVVLPISGTYYWNFTIPNMGKQTSSMNFSNANISYKMTGDIYNNQYNMIPLSYDEKDKKIIAIGKGGGNGYSKDGKYFIIFLKDITNKTVTIFKNSKGFDTKKEADNYARPVDDEEKEHGWNVYTKK